MLRNKNLAFQNNAQFINCISKINGVKIDNAEDLEIVMPMYYLLEYSKNYRKTTGSLWNYYRNEQSNPLSSNSESFKHKTSSVGKKTQNNDSLTNASYYSTKTFMLTGDGRDSFSDDYVENVGIKDFNVLIGGKSFFDVPVKMKKKLTRKLLK